MKKWSNPTICELEIANTEHGWFKKYWDGGYIGDGQLSGHSTNDETKTPGYKPPTENEQPTEQHS